MVYQQAKKAGTTRSKMLSQRLLKQQQVVAGPKGSSQSNSQCKTVSRCQSAQGGAVAKGAESRSKKEANNSSVSNFGNKGVPSSLMAARKHPKHGG